jgi:hypothetical protein
MLYEETRLETNGKANPSSQTLLSMDLIGTNPEVTSYLSYMYGICSLFVGKRQVEATFLKAAMA